MSFLEKRDQYKQFREVPQSQAWFKVYDIGDNILAIYEPYHFQEVISYLIKDEEKALLFDTGLGVGNMKQCVSELWDKELIVTNSHHHFDHIADNWRFDKVYVFDHEDMLKAMDEGIPEEFILSDYTEDQFTDDAPTKSFHYDYNPIHYETIKEGHVFDLGKRKFKVVHTPGHAKDEIMLENEEEKLLFTGDEYYPAPLYCFEDTFDEYIETMKWLSEKYKDYKLITSHNEPIRYGTIFADIVKGFEQIKNHEVTAAEDYGHRELYVFETFSIIKKKEEK